MRKGRLLLYLGWLLCCVKVQGQDRRTLLQRFYDTGEDSAQVNAALQLSAYYLNIEGSEVRSLDSARYFMDIAEAGARRLGLEHQLNQALRDKGIVKGMNGDLPTAKKILSQVSANFMRLGDTLAAAYAWRAYGDCIAYDDFPHQDERRTGYLNAYNIYKTTRDQQQTADLLGKVADADLNRDSLDLAMSEMQEVVQQYKELKYRKRYYGYFMLAQICYRKNLMPQSLLARIECVNAFEQDPGGDPSEGATFYLSLAVDYLNQHQYQKALDADGKAMMLARKGNTAPQFYTALYDACRSYARLGRYTEALALYKKEVHYFPHPNQVDEHMLVMAGISVHCGLQDHAWVEATLPALRQLDARVYQDVLHRPDYFSAGNYIAISDPLMRYYMKTMQWDKLDAAYRQEEALPTKNLSVAVRRNLLEYAYTLDSVHGNYLAAWQKFRQINLINDSINNTLSTAQINELEARYQSLAKDKKIQVLNNQAAIQDATLAQRNQALRVTLGGALLLVVLAIVSYAAYKSKQRANKRLNEQQEEINAQNGRLSDLLLDKEKLIEEKDGLILEKEWLLREVHHRVKNNLQIVISLLYNQSAYLENPAAIKAIRDIQNRIQAIAIIHQKLYRRPGSNAVLLTEYVRDLVAYLGGAFGPKLRHIRFTQDLEPVAMDPAQAVPLGLILNEAITNAIKYAFGEAGGEICVSGRLADPEHLCIVIADNGRGFDETAVTGAASLGMEMMKALARQLNGHLEKKNDGGAMIIVTFRLGVPDVVLPGNKAVPVT